MELKYYRCWLLFFFILHLSEVKGQRNIKVLESTLKAGEFGKVSGASLSKGSIAGNSNILIGFTICARFKLKIMGSFVNGNDNRGKVFHIGDSQDGTDIMHGIELMARAQFSVFNLGYVKESKSFNSYLLQDKAGSYDTITPYAWHHWCYSYNNTGYTQMVMVNCF